MTSYNGKCYEGARVRGSFLEWIRDVLSKEVVPQLGYKKEPCYEAVVEKYTKKKGQVLRRK